MRDGSSEGERGDGTLPGAPDGRTPPGERVQRQTRRTPTPYPWAAAWMGVLFLVVGAAVGVFGSREAGDEALLVAVFGGFFALVGAWLAGYVVAYQLRLRRARAPGTPPWERDRRWDRTGVSDDGYRRGLRALVVVAVLALFLVPFHWILLGRGAEGIPGWALWLPWGVVGIFDLILLLVAGSALTSLWGRRRWGPTRLAFRDFPFRRGGTLEATFDGGRRFAEVDELRAELVCVEERFESSGGDRVQVFRALHRDVRTLEVDALGRADVSFELPEDAPPTDFWAGGPDADEGFPRYWEVELTADARGVDYRGRFLVPVY